MKLLSFRYSNRLKLTSLEGVRNLIYEYACQKCTEIEDLHAKDRAMTGEDSEYSYSETEDGSDNDGNNNNSHNKLCKFYHEDSATLGARIKDTVVQLSVLRADGFTRAVNAQSSAIASNQAEIERTELRLNRYHRRITKYNSKLPELKARQVDLRRRRDIDHIILRYLNIVAERNRSSTL